MSRGFLWNNAGTPINHAFACVGETVVSIAVCGTAVLHNPNITMSRDCERCVAFAGMRPVARTRTVPR